jgi:hypothetical protein
MCARVQRAVRLVLHGYVGEKTPRLIPLMKVAIGLQGVQRWEGETGPPLWISGLGHDCSAENRGELLDANR